MSGPINGGRSHLLTQVNRPHAPIWFARVLTITLLGVFFVTFLAGCGTKRDAETEYEATMDQIEKIQERLDQQELYELSPEDLAWLEDEFVILSDRVDRLDDLSSLPLGLGQVAEFGSPRYRSTLQMLEVAKLLAESGQIIANIGNESLTALEDTGIRYESEDQGETWLEVVERRDDELDEALDIMQEALIKREEIEESELPGRVQGNLAQIDGMIANVESQLELADKRDSAYEAFGSNGLRRYLVLFQNPTELRPTGGFVGTIAELELLNGQIYSYDIQDVYEVSRSYNASDHVVEPPLGIAQFVRADKLQFQDANWWADFPRSAQLLMEMSSATGRDEYDGVAAVQPEIIQDMLTITGPITVDVDGEAREVTSDNLLDEAERQRRISREGVETEAGHKEVIEVIGDALLDRLSRGDRDELVPTVKLVFDRLDVRDMQAYHVDPDVQGLLEEQNWAGLMEPDPELPTLGAVVANVTGLKTSLAMQPELHLELSEPASDGRIEAALTVTLQHTGDAQGDSFYEGFQRYWIDVHLPGSGILDSADGRSADDPDAGSGGAYIVNLDVGETQQIVVRFSMPAKEVLVMRRQPGLVLADVVIQQDGCADSISFQHDRDYAISLGSGCPEIIQEDESS